MRFSNLKRIHICTLPLSYCFKLSSASFCAIFLIDFGILKCIHNLNISTKITDFQGLVLDFTDNLELEICTMIKIGVDILNQLTLKTNVETSIVTLKSGSHFFFIFSICFNESPLKMMKRAFYSILKAL